MNEYKKPHRSPSQINLYSRCPEAWRRRYIEREIIPPAIVAQVGKGVHHGAKVNFKQKLETRRDLPAKEIVDASVAELEKLVKQDGVLLNDEEKSRGQNVVVAEAIDNTVRFAEAHSKLQAPEYQPLLMEQEARIVLPLENDLLCRVDLIDERMRIADFKTSGKSKQQSEADNSIQLTCYALAGRSILANNSVESVSLGASDKVHEFPLVQLDVLVRSAKAVKRQVLQSTRTREDIQVLANRMKAIDAAIQSGSFPPADPSAWNCDKRYCGYWNSCPYVNHSRTARKDD